MKLKQKPSGIYYIDTQLPGEGGALKRSRVSFDTRDKKDAEAQLRDWLAGTHPKHPAQGGTIAPKGRSSCQEGSVKRNFTEGTCLREWLDRCLSDKEVWRDTKAWKNHKSSVRKVSVYLAEGQTVEDFTSKAAYELHDALDRAGYAAGSRRKLLGIVSTALKRAAMPDVALIPSVPLFPSVKVSNRRERVVTLDEEAVMFECIEARRHAEPLKHWKHFERLCRLLLSTAFRRGEALHCGPSNVKRKRWTNHAGEVLNGTWIGLPGSVTKNSKPRDVPATSVMEALIPELNEHQAGGRWFPWAQGSARPIQMLGMIREDMKLRGYNFDDVVLHTFRHTCATRLAEGGMDLLGLRDWLGHSDIKITAERYVHLMNGHIHRGAAILDTFGASPLNQRDTVPNSSEGTIKNNLGNGRECAEPVTARLN